jgi:hypothetical protein
MAGIQSERSAAERLQRAGGAGGALLGAGSVLTTVVFLLSAIAFGIKPMVIGKTGQSYDYVHAMLPWFVPLVIVMSVLSLVALVFIPALNERLHAGSPALSQIAIMSGYIGIVAYQVMLLSYFFIELRMIAGTPRPAIEELFPGFFVLYSSAGLVAALFLAVWVFLSSWMARAGNALPRGLRYLGFLAAVALVNGEFGEWGQDHPVEVFLVGLSLLTGIWLIWAGTLVWLKPHRS